MKLQIDTTAKTITLEASVKMDEFISALKKLFPDNEWKEFQLLTNTVISWGSPIIIKEYPHWEPLRPISPYTAPYQPYPWITYQSGTPANGELQMGVYNVELLGL